jgi:P27 family predicted phage terminase small subunit
MAKVNFTMKEGLSPETLLFMDDVMKYLNRAKAVNNIDLGALRMLAVSYEMYLRSTIILQNEGPILKYKKRLILNPAQNAANKNYDQVIKIMTEYGLTIKSRSRISTLKDDKTADTKTPIVQFMKKAARGGK